MHGSVQRTQPGTGSCPEQLPIWDSTKGNRDGGGKWGTGKGMRGE